MTSTVLSSVEPNTDRSHPDSRFVWAVVIIVPIIVTIILVIVIVILLKLIHKKATPTKNEYDNVHQDVDSDRHDHNTISNDPNTSPVFP